MSEIVVHLDPYFGGLADTEMQSLFKRFLMSPQNTKSELFKDRSTMSFITLSNGANIEVFRGDLSENYLTFNKLCAYLGRMNQINWSTKKQLTALAAYYGICCKT
jgi:hypothetical protein